MARRKPHTEPNAEATVEVCRRATKGKGTQLGMMVIVCGPHVPQPCRILQLYSYLSRQNIVSPRLLSQGQVRETAAGT